MLIIFMFLFVISILIQKLINTILRMAYRIKINSLLDNINTKDDLLYMAAKDLKHVIALVFRRKGFKVDINDRLGEGGDCLILDNLQCVQIKKYSCHHIIEIEEAKKLVKHMQDNSIYMGMIITLGDFKNNTKKFCYTNVIKCVNGDNLLAMCKEAQKISNDIALGRI